VENRDEVEGGGQLENGEQHQDDHPMDGADQEPGEESHVEGGDEEQPKVNVQLPVPTASKIAPNMRSTPKKS